LPSCPTNILHFPARVVVTAADHLPWRTPQYLEELSGVRDRLSLPNACYMAQSLICTTLFYGYGFGLYGRLQRYEL
jgi:Protein of unknown function (DUF418)